MNVQFYQNLPYIKPNDENIVPPQEREKFTEWIRNVFTEKDAKMVTFFDKGYFISESETVKIMPAFSDWLVFVFLLALLYFVLVPAYYALVLRLIGFII